MSPGRLRKVAVPLAVLVGIQAAAAGIYLAVQRSRDGSSADEFRVERLSTDLRAPDIVLERADGTRVSIRRLGGTVQIIHFWATWCPPCVEELPGLLSTSRELAGRGLTLAAISMDDDWDDIRSFFDGDVPAEIYRAVDPKAHNEYDIVQLPDSYLVGPNGELELRYGGARNWRARAARDHLEAQLP